MIPPEAQLTAGPGEVPAWADIDAAFKPVLDRQMEIYAGCAEALPQAGRAWAHLDGANAYRP